MLPSFIRYFADTSDSALGRTALEYGKALCRIAPVRVVSLTGGLAGPWLPYSELQMTPMTGVYVNCVCADPSKWTWVNEVTMTDHEFADILRDPKSVVARKEIVAERAEIYTAGVRNVLFVAVPPRDEHQLATAKKYEAIVFWRSGDGPQWWEGHCRVVGVKTPVTDHATLRRAVLDAPDPEGPYR